jgi:hypothetical protein
MLAPKMSAAGEERCSLLHSVPTLSARPLLAHRLRSRGVAACRLTGTNRKFVAGRQLGGL